MLVRYRETLEDMGRVGRYADQLFGKLLPTTKLNTYCQSKGGTVDVDVYQDDESVVIKAAIPGINPDQLEVTITGDTLVIKGETFTDAGTQNGKFLWRERQYGPFLRSLKLPGELNTGKVQCTYESGVLGIIIPKEEAARPKSLKVNVVGH